MSVYDEEFLLLLRVVKDLLKANGTGGGSPTPVDYSAATFTDGYGTITDTRIVAYIKDSNGNFFQTPTINQVGSAIIIDLGTGITPSGTITIGFYN